MRPAAYGLDFVFAGLFQESSNQEGRGACLACDPGGPKERQPRGSRALLRGVSEGLAGRF